MNLTGKVNRIIELAAQAAASDSPKAREATICLDEARSYMKAGRLSAAGFRAARGVRHEATREAFRLYDEVAP